jgi:transcriptional regulator with XRE-family HTH domain
VPPFYASVELTGRRGPGGRCAFGEFATGIRDEKHADRELWRPPASLFDQQKQQNGLGNNKSRIALSESSLQGSATVMTRKKRQPTSADIQVGASLRAHRLIVGMSQGDLARKLGVSFQQIQKYEKGTNRVGAGRLPQIAKIFDIPISALFDASANASPGKSAGTVPIKLIPDRSTLKLLNAFGGIAHRKIRHSLVDLVDAIAKATPKTPR